MSSKSRSITAHCVIRNEENWIWYSINSVINYVNKILVYDTGSTDNTVKIVKSIKSPKIIFEQKGRVDKKKFMELRQKMLDKTKTDWFIVLDGDEIWPDSAIKNLKNEIINSTQEKEAIVVGEWICIGDVFHYSKELAQAKQKQYKGRIGFRMVRAIKNMEGLHCIGEYGNESYADKNNSNVSYWNTDRLVFLKGKFFHMSFLQRSSSMKKDREVMMRAPKRFFYKGEPFPGDFKYPEVFYKKRPKFVPSPWQKLTLSNQLVGLYYRAFNLKDRLTRTET